MQEYKYCKCMFIFEQQLWSRVNMIVICFRYKCYVRRKSGNQELDHELFLLIKTAYYRFDISLILVNIT